MGRREGAADAAAGPEGAMSMRAPPAVDGRRTWRCGPHAIPWGPGVAPALMAVVNTTPDSFSDGGLHLDPAAAAAHAARCIAEGAAIVDIGGESTRPGAVRIPADAQLARTLPVLQALPRHAIASIDTTLAPVATAALAAGAAIVNDVSACTEDPSMLATVAAAGAGLVLMHRLAPPPQDRWSDEHPAPPAYADVVHDVRDFLAARIDAAVRAGVRRECIAVDPGLGFGKDVAQNLELVARLDEFAVLGCPVLVGASRKRFVGAVTGESDPARRDAGSVGVALAAVAGGAAVLRVHDVALHLHALLAWWAVHEKHTRRTLPVDEGSGCAG
jgi:dihydropteroate synthase